jgi:hypothetical protein
MAILTIIFSHYDADYEDFGAHFPRCSEDALQSIPAAAQELLLGMPVKC